MGDLPRTLTGGLVDPMKTKLEMMVAYLAGRKGEAAESIRRELEDPTSEASRCLEAVRSRSRGVFGADLPEMPDPIPSRSIRNRATARGSPGDGCLRCSSAPRLLRWCSSRWVWRGGRRMTGSATSKRPSLGARLGGETVSTVSRRPSRDGRHLRKGSPLARMDQTSKS